MQTIIRSFEDHPATSTALGLSPLAAKCTTVSSGAGMGMVFALVLILSSVCLLISRRFIPYRFQFIFILLVTATWASIIDMGLQAWFFQLSMTLDIYVFLTAVNALLLTFLQQSPLLESPASVYKKTAITAAGVFMFIVVTGSVRELLGQGALLGSPVLFPQSLSLFNSAAGAFIVLGILMALIKSLTIKRSGSAINHDA